ncbi:ABC transporter permease [Rothia sp. HMSC072B04]|uniref:ABC transporter permease n=1 Tax=Rothia sp. HMSC072B04 TaxID=1739432 RepID=UPI0008A3FB34|nr:ABC transporter permease [Rothia sp. HMSC072B04]OFQ60954.1 ABC transporter permease [Rothia sp. HMSC072B04]
MHPTSEPAHESSSQTSPGAAKRTYDERAAFEEAKRNLGIVGDKEQEFNRGLAILGKAYSIGMTLILVYFLLDAYQILVTAGRSLNIGSFLSYALPKVLPDAVIVVPVLWIVLGWVKDGYINPRRLTMLYLLLCCVSGVLSFAGVFGMSQVLFPAFTALDPASHPAAASSIVTQVLVAVIMAGSAVLLFLLTRPAVGTVPSFAVIRKQMRAIEESTSGAEDEEELTREDVLRQLEKEEGPVKDSTEQLLRELSADYALSNDPVEKNRLLDEIQQVQRAQKAGVKPNLGGASAGEAGKLHEQAHRGEKATAGSAAPAAPKVVLPPHPKALRGVMWCATAIIILSAIQRIYVSIHNEVPDRVMENMPGIIISGIFATFIFSLIPIFVLRRLWKGRRWAYFLTLFGSAFIVFVGALHLQSFISADYFSRLADESLTSRPRDYVVSIVVSDIMGAFLTAFYLLIVVLLISRPTRSFMATARLAWIEAREQVNAGDGWIVAHQDAETRAHLEEEQTRWEEKEANRRAEEAAAQQYKTTRRTDARRNSRSEQRGYKDTSVYTEEGYRLN